MTTASIFISSVQKELADERRAVKAFVEADALLSKGALSATGAGRGAAYVAAAKRLRNGSNGSGTGNRKSNEHGSYIRDKIMETERSDPFSTHRHNRPIGKLLRVIAEQSLHEFNTSCRRNVGEPHDVTTPHSRQMICPEIFVHGHRRRSFALPFEQNAIPRIRPALARFDYVMPMIAQPVCEAPPRTAINQEFH